MVLRLKDHLPSLLNPRDKNLRQIFLKRAEKNGIKVYHLIFNHTHIHAVLKIEKREDYVRFIREVTARIVSWGRSYQLMVQYMKKNEKESGVAQGKKFVSSQLKFEFG